MTSADDARELVLGLPEVTAAAHFDREAFKVDGKIFATLGGETVNLMLSPEQQAELIADLGDAAVPAAGAWGRRGVTCVRHDDVDPVELREWLAEAWRTRKVARPGSRR